MSIGQLQHQEGAAAAETRGESLPPSPEVRGRLATIGHGFAGAVRGALNRWNESGVPKNFSYADGQAVIRRYREDLQGQSPISISDLSLCGDRVMHILETEFPAAAQDPSVREYMLKEAGLFLGTD